jgi:hypothetical protein
MATYNYPHTRLNSKDLLSCNQWPTLCCTTILDAVTVHQTANKILWLSQWVCSCDTFTKRSCKMHLLTLPCLDAYLSISLSVQSHVINSGTDMCTLLQVIQIFKFCLQQSDNKCQTLYIKTQKHFSSNLKHNLLNNYLWQERFHKSCRENWKILCTYMHSCLTCNNGITNTQAQLVLNIQTHERENTGNQSIPRCALSFMHTTHRAQHTSVSRLSSSPVWGVHESTQRWKINTMTSLPPHSP